MHFLGHSNSGYMSSKMKSSSPVDHHASTKPIKYVNSIIILLVSIPIILGATINHPIQIQGKLHDLFNNHVKQHSNVTVVACMAVLATIYLMSRPRKVYLLDFACYKPDASHWCTKERLVEKTKAIIDDESGMFVTKVLAKSGLGDQTSIFRANDAPIKRPFEYGRQEAEIVLFGTVDELFGKSGVKVEDIGILVVNVSLFNPTPSFSSMIVNRYKLRPDIVSCNLGGMGCSAGIIAIDIANRLLQTQPNTYALVVSSETLSPNFYIGKERSQLVSNCLFRMGGAAILLSNRFSDRRRSKYELRLTLRTHRGGDDRAYKCICQEEDTDGKIGVKLSKDLLAVAGEALQANTTALGPLVLPMSEKFLFVANLVARKVLKMNVKPRVPDFKRAFEHFCIHTGGKGVLDQLEKSLDLSKLHMEPSRMSLYRFGNTSSSSVWYELAYAEAKGRIKKGDRVWQIAFGSGFKCNSGVWRALRTIDPAEEQNPWTDEIDQFPVQIPT